MSRTMAVTIRYPVPVVTRGKFNPGPTQFRVTIRMEWRWLQGPSLRVSDDRLLLE
jgi:hypothetical protein